MTLKIAIFFVLFTNNLFAANLTVSPSGSGSSDGSDWNNTLSWDLLSLSRGNTYYLVDGDYVAKNLSTAVSDETYIYIKKATSTNYADVSATGWASSMGDGQVIITAPKNNLIISTNYWDIDGINGGGNSVDNYGIKLITDGSYTGVSNSILSPTGSYIAIKNVAVVGAGETDGTCIYGVKTNTTNSNIIYYKCYFSDTPVHIVMYQTDNVTIDKCYFENNWSNSTCHGEQLTAGLNAHNWTIKNSKFINSFVGAIAIHDCAGCNGTGYNSGWNIFNNLFVGGSVTMGVVGCADSGPTYPDIFRSFNIHSNTIVNVDGGGFGGGIGNGCYMTTTNYQSYAYNNLFYGTDYPNIKTENIDAITHDYNAFYSCTNRSESLGGNEITAAIDPFVNLATGDYSIDPSDGVLLINSGYSELGADYNTDITGASRPYGAGWDIGAYEYQPPSHFTPGSGRRVGGGSSGGTFR